MECLHYQTWVGNRCTGKVWRKLGEKVWSSKPSFKVLCETNWLVTVRHEWNLPLFLKILSWKSTYMPQVSFIEFLRRWQTKSVVMCWRYKVPNKIHTLIFKICYILSDDDGVSFQHFNCLFGNSLSINENLKQIRYKMAFFKKKMVLCEMYRKF